VTPLRWAFCVALLCGVFWTGLTHLSMKLAGLWAGLETFAPGLSPPGAAIVFGGVTGLSFFFLLVLQGGSAMKMCQCIGCGCDDLHACASETTGQPCSWLRVDDDQHLGVCSECPEALERWDSGDRAFAVPV
jgi:hypothetical protein